jgi:hypothetical protein
MHRMQEMRKEFASSLAKQVGKQKSTFDLIAEIPRIDARGRTHLISPVLA